MVAAGWTSGRDAIGREIDLMEAFPHFSSAFLLWRACMAKYRVNHDGCVIQSIWRPILGNGKISEGPVDKVPHRRELCLPAVYLEQLNPFHPSAHLRSLLPTFPSTAWTKDVEQRKTFLNLGKKPQNILEWLLFIYTDRFPSFSPLHQTFWDVWCTQVLRSIYFEFTCKFQLQ